ncbi:signal peptidase [Mycoplasma sp. CAG:877]|nr:signal peptidase [Mycoplasma sp. CAG:877]
MKKLLENKTFQIIYTIIKIFVVAMLSIYLLFVIVQRFTNNSSILGYRVFTIATGSMEPVYNINDVILVKDTAPSTLKKGDDIAYLGNRDAVKGLIVTHRIIRIETFSDGKVHYTLKGVNNKYEDPSITEDQILGKVVGKLPVVNFINHVVKNIYGFFFLVFCPLVLVIFLEIADTIIDMKLEKNEIRLIEKEDKKSKKKNKKENISNNEELDEDVDTDTSVLDSDVEVIDDDHVLYSEVDVVSGYSNTNNDEELVEDLESLEDINIEKNVGDGDAEEEEVI